MASRMNYTCSVVHFYAVGVEYINTVIKRKQLANSLSRILKITNFIAWLTVQ